MSGSLRIAAFHLGSHCRFSGIYLSKAIASKGGMVRTANRFPLILALLVAIASNTMAESPHTGQNSATPGTRVMVKLFRNGTEQTLDDRGPI